MIKPQVLIKILFLVFSLAYFHVSTASELQQFWRVVETGSLSHISSSTSSQPEDSRQVESQPSTDNRSKKKAIIQYPASSPRLHGASSQAESRPDTREKRVRANRYLFRLNDRRFAQLILEAGLHRLSLFKFSREIANGDTGKNLKSRLLVYLQNNPETAQQYRVKVSQFLLNKRVTSHDGSLLKLNDSSALVDSATAVAAAATNTISGTISLPGGGSAPTGGLAVSITADDGVTFIRDSVTILGGTNSIPYSLNVPDDAASSWRIRYNCFTDCPPIDFLDTGYYNGSGTTSIWDNATLMTGGVSHSGIGMELIVAKSISGTISLPNSATAPAGGLDVSIYADDGANFRVVLVTIPAGTNSETYSIAVPMISVDSWRVEYDCFDDCPLIGYVNIGYYNSTATTPIWDDATLLAGGVDHAGIEMELLLGNKIEGTITLPGTDSAPAGGLWIDIEGWDSTNYNSGYGLVFVAEGKSFADYSLVVPSDASVNWAINYWCSDCPAYGYLQTAYYNSTGTTTDLSNATLLAGGTDHTGIDMDLLPGKSISGTISLPESDTAPAGGMWIDLNAECQDKNVYLGVFIDAGMSSAPYLLTVSDDVTASWKIRYICSECAAMGYLEQGYYNSNGTTYDFNNASLLVGGADHSNIDMKVLRGNAITGTVFLPGGAVAPAEGLWVDLNATENPNIYQFWTGAFIDPGQISGAYTLSVPIKAASWYVLYNCFGCTYLPTGYYAGTDTAAVPDQTLLLLGEMDHSSIDITLLDEYFDDVPQTHPDYTFITHLAQDSQVTGCTPRNFCPDQIMDRSTATIWLLNMYHFGGWQPPSASGKVFIDVAIDDFAADWIEEFSRNTFTDGCGDGSQYCPTQLIAKNEAAKLVGRTYSFNTGGNGTEPAASGAVFDDVGASDQSAGWIEELKTDFVTEGCDDTNYCLYSLITRAGFAKMLDKRLFPGN